MSLESQRSLSNQEALSGDKILYATDFPRQDLNPNGGNRIVTLHEREFGEITNDSDGTNSLSIREKIGGTTVVTLSAATKYKAIEFRLLPDGSYRIVVQGGY